MKNVHAGLLALAVAAIAIPALADPPAAPAPAPAASASAPVAPSASVITVGSAVIRGRLAKPQVLIELQRQSPASAAGAAHDQLRAQMQKKLEPSATRAVR